MLRQLLLPLLALVALAMSTGAARVGNSGEEFVKACDSGSDDVTNQCINRIPEDIGMSSGNHACAYHEAEVRCLGLCGNTITWKVAYQNALKRYRLVCASYIKDRLADKEEDEGPAEYDSARARPAPPPPPPRKAAPAPAKPKAPVAPKPSSTQPASSQPASSTARNASKATAPAAAKPKASANRARASQQDTSTDASNVHAVLPTMDPELAGAAAIVAHAAPLLAWALAGAAAALHLA